MRWLYRQLRNKELREKHKDSLVQWGYALITLGGTASFWLVAYLGFRLIYYHFFYYGK